MGKVTFLCGIPIQVFMKVFEAKERQGRYLGEMPPRFVRVPSLRAGRVSSRKKDMPLR
jgi:hypothetical protein